MTRRAAKRGIHLVERQLENPEKNPQVDLKRKTFKTGEIVPQSGIYRVTHAEHRLPHEVTMLRSHEFPPCEKCGIRVRFKLLRGVSLDSFQIVLNSLPELVSDVVAEEPAADTIEKKRDDLKEAA